MLAIQQGNYLQAEAYFQEGLNVARTLNTPWSLGDMLIGWGKLCLKQEQWAQASAAFLEVLAVTQAVGIQEMIGEAHFGLAQVAWAAGKFTEAHEQAQTALTILASLGHVDADSIRQWLANRPSDLG